MAKRRTPPGCKPVSTDVPTELAARFHELAEKNGRPYRDELIHAMERHLAQPPNVHIITPPLSKAEATYEPKPRGRPRQQHPPRTMPQKPARKPKEPPQTLPAPKHETP